MPRPAVRLGLVALLVAVAAGCGRSDLVGGPDPGGSPADDLPPMDLGNPGPGLHREPGVRMPDGSGLRYAVSVPESYHPKKPCPLVLLLHYDYSGPAPDAHEGAELAVALAPGLNELGAVVVAPDARGGDWTAAQNEAAAVWLTRSAMKTYRVPPNRVAVVGYSIGGKGAWHLAERYPELFSAAVPIAAEPPAGPPRVPTCVVHSADDEVVPFAAVRDRVAGWKAGGAAVELVRLSGPDHYQYERYADGMRQAAVWLNARWK